LKDLVPLCGQLFRPHHENQLLVDTVEELPDEGCFPPPATFEQSFDLIKLSLTENNDIGIYPLLLQEFHDIAAVKVFGRKMLHARINPLFRNTRIHDGLLFFFIPRLQAFHAAFFSHDYLIMPTTPLSHTTRR
jgi:hypothetical protein